MPQTSLPPFGATHNMPKPDSPDIYIKQPRLTDYKAQYRSANIYARKRILLPKIRGDTRGPP